ncbi:MAG TPA: G1 family glutamic endopeptidase [Pseudonocardiaceae bacterium]|nr:G1 family glutamic endopeptidase [Pseudonocardiaceae bacterium]
MSIQSLRSLTVAALAVAGLVVTPAAAMASTAHVDNNAPNSHANVSHSPDHVLSQTPFDQQSSNWSGYAETGSGYTSASVTWTVPSASQTSGDTYGSDWVGIDGDGNSDLIQTGTEEDYVGGQAEYGAWWEILPAAETPIPNMTISPGDSVTGTVAQQSGSSWKITLTDNSTGQSFNTTQDYSGPGQSVEYIEESPEVGGSIATPADLSTATFSGATVNGSSPNLSSSDAIDLVQNGTTYYKPSAPNSSGDGFTVSYEG